MLDAWCGKPPPDVHSASFPLRPKCLPDPIHEGPHSSASEVSIMALLERQQSTINTLSGKVGTLFQEVSELRQLVTTPQVYFECEDEDHDAMKHVSHKNKHRMRFPQTSASTDAANEELADMKKRLLALEDQLKDVRENGSEAATTHPSVRFSKPMDRTTEISWGERTRDVRMRQSTITSASGLHHFETHHSSGHHLSRDNDKFCPVMEARKEHGSFRLELPRSSWAAAMAFTLIRDPEMRPSVFFFFNVMPQFISLAGSIFVQGGYIIYLRQITVEKVEFVCPTDFVALRILCLGTLFSVVYRNSAMAILDMARWISCLPTLTDHSSGEPNSGMLFKSVTDKSYETERSYILVATGVSMKYRILVITTFIIPQIVLMCLVLFYAGGHVALTDNKEELILNAVAVVFILDIDKICYTAFTTNSQKVMFESLPPVGKADVDWTFLDSILEVAGSWLMIPFWFGGTAAL